MENLDGVKRSVLGNMILRQTMGGTRKEDKIKDKDDLIERIREEYDMQNSKTTHKLDLTMLDVSLVEDMFNLFLICHRYDLESIDVSNWDTHNVECMRGMFDNCVSLKSVDVSKWDVSNVKDMQYMFTGCSSLESVDVSNWDVSNVKDMYSMFYRCSSLESIDVSNWNVSNVEDMNYMFYGCKFKYKKEGNRLIRI